MPNERYQGKLPLKSTASPSPVQRLKSSLKKGVARSTFGHPWMTLAAVLSVVLPIGIAFLPAGSSGRSTIDAALDELPIPATIEIHNADAMPLSPPEEDVVVSAGTPRRLDAGWEETPAWPGSPAARHAAYRDDLESPGEVQTVGSNRPAPARPRGAWLTGGIEEVPSTAPKSRSSRPRD